MKPILVFYANQLYGEYDYQDLRLLQVQCGQEIYNGGYMYDATFEHDSTWYRMDGTPVLPSDVPKELLTLLLLMT